MNKDEMRKMWAEAYAGKLGSVPTDGGIRGPTRPNPQFPDGVIIDGPRKPPRTTDEFGRPLPPKPWTPGDEDRRKPRGDKYPSPRPETSKAEKLRRFPPKPHTGPDTPPSMMHDKEAIKGYPSAAKPPINNIGNNIGKSDSINHENNKSYKPQNPKP